MKYGGKNTKISFALVFAGLLFFFNPCVNLFDILPDFFGALLIYAGLKKAGIADGYFEDARKISFYMIWLYVLKTAFSFAVISNSKNALPYTFISSVLEIIFLFAFFHKLFAGFEYTLMRCGTGRGNVPVNEAYAYSMIFAAAKCVITFLPELFEIAIQSEEAELSASAGYYMTTAKVKNYAVLFGVFVQLILGIIFIAVMAHFFSKIRKYTSYRQFLAEKYNAEMTANRTKYVNRALALSCTLAVFCTVFTADFFVEGIDFLPDILIAVLFAMCMRALCAAGDYVKFPMFSVLGMFAASAFTTVLSFAVTPERFELLSHEKSMFENHLNGSFDGKSGIILTAASGVLFAAAAVCAVLAFVRRSRLVYEKELMGNHDRKLLAVGVTVSLSAAMKTAYNIAQSVCAFLASEKEVSEFVSGRALMTQQKMNSAINSSELIAKFVKCESISSFFMWAMVIFCAAAVFNIFALKAEAVKED